MLRAILPPFHERAVRRVDLLGALADGAEANSAAAVAGEAVAEACEAAA